MSDKARKRAENRYKKACKEIEEQLEDEQLLLGKAYREGLAAANVKYNTKLELAKHEYDAAIGRITDG
jgi:hypothetical protein